MTHRYFRREGLGGPVAAGWLPFLPRWPHLGREPGSAFASEVYPPQSLDFFGAGVVAWAASSASISDCESPTIPFKISSLCCPSPGPIATGPAGVPEKNRRAPNFHAPSVTADVIRSQLEKLRALGYVD